MLVRGFVAVSFGEIGGSAFTKNCRPPSSTTLAIWPLAPFAKKDARKIAQDASVARWNHAVIAVRLIIRLLPRFGRGRAPGRLTTIFELAAQSTVFYTVAQRSMFLRY